MFRLLPKRLWRACKFAKALQDKGEDAGLANYKAGQYYGYSDTQVAIARNELKALYKRKEG